MAAGNHAGTHGPQQNVEHRHKSAGMKCNGYKVISSLKALPHMVQGGFLSDLRRFRDRNGAMAECLSQTRNFAKARFSEI